MPMILTVVVVETQSRSRAGPTRCSAKAWPNWVLRPAAPRWASLRRSVLASGARSNPGTRHKSRGNYSLRLPVRTNALIAPMLSPIGTSVYTRYWWQKSIYAQSPIGVGQGRRIIGNTSGQDHVPAGATPDEQAKHWHHLHPHMGLYY